jgi:Ser/Thr protein kinase RdoA (MazF antagonist)
VPLISLRDPAPAVTSCTSNRAAGCAGDREPQALLLAAAAGVPSRTARRLGSSTNVVWHLPDTAHVLRIAAAETPAGAVTFHLALAAALAAAGVPFARPALPGPVTAAGMTASLWHYDEPSGMLNYTQFGAATRALHTLGTAAIAASPLAGAVPHVLDADAITARLDHLEHTGRTTPAETAHLRRSVDHFRQDMAALPPAPSVLVHDDLWPKNAVQTAGGVLLIDPDNISWGPAQTDLAFITRAIAAGDLTAADGHAFEAGYGAPLPSPAAADSISRGHRLRWVCTLLGRREWHPTAAADLVEELPRWATAT